MCKLNRNQILSYRGHRPGDEVEVVEALDVERWDDVEVEHLERAHCVCIHRGEFDALGWWWEVEVGVIIIPNESSK